MPYADIHKQREYQRQWMAQRREAFFAGKRCVRCRSGQNLELHHTDPSVKESHRIWSWSEARFDAEISKCIILCRDCHTEHHASLLRGPEHSAASYSKRGCRCPICREAIRQRMADYRQRLRTAGKHNGHALG